jgi:hypothetical protein
MRERSNLNQENGRWRGIMRERENYKNPKQKEVEEEEG